MNNENIQGITCPFVVGQRKKPSAKRKRSRKEPISLTIDRDLLIRIDQMAKSQGLSRAALIAQGMSYVVEHGIWKD